MRTLLPDPPPPAFAKLLAERERCGNDRRDEVWEGVLHMNPPAGFVHERVAVELALVLSPAAKLAGLALTGPVGIGGPTDYRVPDLSAHRPGAAPQWNPTCALAIEILSRGDDTWKKLDFYAAHAVDELVIVDPGTHSVQWLALTEGDYRPVARSGVIDLSADELATRVDWPA